MSSIHERHIALVEAVNAAPAHSEEERVADARLDGFLSALKVLGFSIGHLVMAADAHYLNQGIDRPMCGGVFLSKEEVKP